MAGRDFSAELFGAEQGRDLSKELFGPAPVPPPPPEGGFFPAVKRGVLQTGMLLGDVLPAMAARAVGADEYAERQLKEAAETQARIQREVPAAVPSFTDISGIGDAWMYAKEAVGESLISIIPSIITGGAAAVVGRPAIAAANQAAKEAAERTLMAAAMKAGPPTQAAIEAAKKEAVEAGIKAAQSTALKYEVTGAFAGSAVQNIPEVYQNVLEETGKESIPAALAFGGFNAALDSVLPVGLLRKMRAEGLSPTETMAAWYKRGAKGLGTGFLVEGGTEAAQETSSIAAENFVAENREFFNSKNLERVINAGLKGGLGGGVITGATDIALGKAPPPEVTDRQKAEQLQREILGDLQVARAEQQLAEEQEAARLKAEAERPPTVNEIVSLASKPNGYGELESVKQRLLTQTRTPETREALDVIREIQGRMLIEEQQRRAPSPPTIPTTDDLFRLAQMPDGYGQLEITKQNLLKQPKTPETQEALDAIKDFQNRLITEQIDRTRQPVKIEMDDKTIRSLGFAKSENPNSVYQQLLGKSPSDPLVIGFLENYANTKAKPQTKERIERFLGQARRYQMPLTAEEVAKGAADARQAITAPSGEGVPVVGKPPAVTPAPGVGEAKPTGVVPAEEDVGQPPRREAAAPAAVTPKIEALQGSETRLILPDGEKRSANWEVIEADSVSAAMIEGRAQPRDRQRAASNAQVQSIANNPDFDRLSDTSQTMDYGAPTLTSEYVIVGGNGRFEGINLSYNTEAGQAYKQNLISNAQRFGLDPATVSGMKKPVLVRKISSASAKPEDTRKLAIQSNIVAGLEMSDMERAALDSERMTNLQELDITDTGDIPLTTKNMGTIRDALKGYTKEELSGMLAADGTLSQSGLRRVKNAVLYKAYGKTDTLSRLLESPDADLKNVGTALMRASGSMSRLMDGIKSGAIPSDYDIIADLTGAVETLSALRASGTKVQDFINQSDMFGGGISNEAKTILTFLDQNLRSAKSITEFLNDYAAAAISAEGAGGGLFGEIQLPSKQETVERAAQRQEAERAAAKTQQTIFQQPTGAPATEGAAKPEGAGRPPEGGEGAVTKPSLPAAAPAPKPLKLSKETEAKIEELGKILERILGKFGLRNVALNIERDLKNNGEYANRLIKLALDADSPVRDLRHESLHAMKELGFFSDAQWKTLEKMARDKWVDKYLKNRPSSYEGQPMSRYDAYMRLYNGNEDLILEEAIADAFSDFDITKPPAGLMQTLLRRMRDLFRGIKEAMGLANIDNAEDIFRRVEKGQLKETAAAPAEAPKPSLRAPETEAFKKWFGNSKVVDENGDPLVVYHGTNKTDSLADEPDQAIGQFDSYVNWFTTDPYQASGYATQDGRKVEGAATYPAYLSLQKPLRLRGDLNDKTTYAEFRKETGLNVQPGPYEDEVIDGVEQSIPRWWITNSPSFADTAEAAGYDGVIANEGGTRTFGVFYQNPGKIKSATGNVGDFRLSEADIRYSLRAPTTPAFKKWFGDSKIVNPDGTPKVMYHGTARDITEFRPKQAGAIFVTDRPDFAEMFADASNDWIARHYKDFLSADQIKAAKSNVPRILKEMGYRGDEAASYKKQIEMDNPSGGALDVWTAALKEQLPTGPNVMPLYVRAEKPFDFENPEHIKAIQKLSRYELPLNELREGSWRLIEMPRMQELIKEAGFDGFYVKEGGVKNLAVYKPSQLKSATGNIGTFDITKPDIRYSLRDSLGLYSELEAKIAQGPNKAPAASWKAYINGLTQKGVKPEEIEWSGVRDWLDLQTGPVSKDAVNAYLKQGGVKVEETVLGQGSPDIETFLTINDLRVEPEGETHWFVESPTGSRLIAKSTAPTEDAAKAFAVRYFNGHIEERNRERRAKAQESKFGQYTLPGGENYREVLLTLPSKIGTVDIEGWTAKVKRPVSPVTRKPEYEIFDASGKSVGTVYTEEQELDAIKTLARRIAQDKTEKQQFKSTHWDQPNVLAHIRLNDRTDADGKKVLFVEEIQSDWGQEGKRKGFRDEEANKQMFANESRIENIESEIRDINFQMRGLPDSRMDEFNALADARQKLYDEQQRLGEEINLLRDRAAGEIKPAPFVTKTEGWLNLALKRIMVMAAEGGYDKVAFVNGQQSADRYDLSKQVTKIEYASKESARQDSRALTVYGLQGQEILSKNVPEQELPDLIGKEATERLLAAEPKSIGGKAKFHIISGDGLKVGGEGMKAFYNQIVPIAVKKLLPKVGGGQATTVQIEIPGATNRIDRPRIETLNQPGFDVTPDMKRKVETTGLPRFSLREPRLNLRDQLDPATRARMDQTIAPRDEKTFGQRMMEAISPKTYSFFRTQFVNRYDGLSKLDKMKVDMMGGVDMLADAGAESAALLSDLGAGVAASAMGVNDGRGGVPVYKHYFVVEVNNRALAKQYTTRAQAEADAQKVNGVVRERGFTTVVNFDNTIQGPVGIFAPLMAKYKDMDIFQIFQFYSAVKRGARFMYTLDAKGNVIEKLFEPADIQKANALEQQYPELKEVHANWIKYNDKLVDFMRDTGVISKEGAEVFKMHGDYFPFYRQIDEQDDAVGPRIFQSIAAVKAPSKIKGGEARLGDFFENMVRNTQSAIQAGMKNVAARRAAELGQDVGIVFPVGPGQPTTGPEIFHVLENGQRRFYATTDPMMMGAIKSLNLPDMPGIGILAGPANLLRNLVTKDPGFILANLMRDSMSAWATSGVKMTPIADTVANFGKALFTDSKEYKALQAAGVVGGYEFSHNVETSAKAFGGAIRKAAGVPTITQQIARPVTSVWEALEKATGASDAATRMEVYKKTLAETGNEAEAVFRAMEVMNFNRKGSSAIIRILTAAVPFLNARIQGLDILYRAGIAPSFDASATERAKQVQKTFFIRGAMMAALSAMYWAMTHDDEDYKKQEQETRDNYWLLPSLGIKIPIPFEVGVLFKVIPERILGYTMGDDTGKDFLKSMGRQILNTFAFNPIPQTFIPIVETVTNFSFFTWRPILPQGMENVAPEYQVGPGTSKLAEGIGKAIGASPIRIDQLISGYTGTMGMYMVDLMDAIFNTMTDSPKPSKRFEQMPVIRRFAVDPEARGTVTAYYDLKNAVDEVVRTSNLLERTMDYEGYGKYMQENMQILASREYVLDMEKTLKEFREMKTLIRSSNFSADAKRDYLTTIGQMENALTSNIQQLKKLYQ